MRLVITFALGVLVGILIALAAPHPSTRGAEASRPVLVYPAESFRQLESAPALAGAPPEKEAARPGGSHGTPTPSPSNGTRAARTEAPATAKPSPAHSRARVAQRQRQRSEGPSSAGSSPAPSTKHRLTGISTWYAYRPGEAAAGPRLRAALGRYWRGSKVSVCSTDGNCLSVRLTDFMGTRNRAKVIDLDAGLFPRVCGRPLSAGVCDVTVTWKS